MSADVRAADGDTDRSVFGRVLAVIGAFRDSPEAGLTASEVAAATGLPMSTAHRLCRSLADERVLERTADGRYRVGIRLWELGLLAPRSQGLRQRALPFLEDLHEVTGQHVQLMVLDGIDAVVVERLSTKDAVVLEGRTGGRLPVHATSGGIVLLSLADDDTVAAVLQRPLERFTPATITTEPMLRATLSLARRQGWIALEEHLTPGSVSVAAPVHGSRRRLVGAVSVIVDSTDGSHLVPAVLTTARAIGRALGA